MPDSAGVPRAMLQVLCLALLSLGAVAQTVSPLDNIRDFAYFDYFSNDTTTAFVTSGLSASGRTLQLGGRPLLVRGVTYSPTPIGISLTVDALTTDFFDPTYEGVWRRDLPLMARMGINTVRVYDMKPTGDHTGFLDLAHSLNLTVLAGFPITRFDAPLRQDNDVENTKVRLREAIAHNRHPAIGMWLVGNEANLAENQYLCQPGQFCHFWDDAVNLYSTLDSLCEVVEQEGHLCTAPLADVPLTTNYRSSTYDWEDFTAYVRLLDSVTPHFHLWMVNTYRGTSFGDLFAKYERVSGKPLLLGEYGIDAYDSVALREDVASHSRYTLALVEELERNSVVCVANCESRVAAGGTLMSWVDEWWKGAPHTSSPPGEQWWACPEQQWNAVYHSNCGSWKSEFPDLFMNEEWWGLLSVATGCSSGDPNRLSPRLAYLELTLLWREGGCTSHDALGSAGHPVPLPYDRLVYPSCGSAMLAERLARLPTGTTRDSSATDCDIMAHVNRTSPSVCPRPPSHMVAETYNQSLLVVSDAFPIVNCDSSVSSELAYNLTNYPKLVTNRLQRVGEGSPSNQPPAVRTTSATSQC